MMKIRKRLKMFNAIVAAFALVLGMSAVFPAAVQAEEQKTCLITIDNGAAEANTENAVNGLHVYDPNSEELDDFVSGTELPAGTEVSVYVYNLASPVQLQIVHNGETIVDKRFEKMQAWVDDDKVEFFDIVLEGDLTVTTKALEDEPE